MTVTFYQWLGCWQGDVSIYDIINDRVMAMICLSYGHHLNLRKVICNFNAEHHD